MLIKIGAALAAVPMSLLALVAATGVLVVDVREGGPAGHHFVVPVPLALAEVASAFVPPDKAHVDLGDARQYLPAADDVLKALAETPDGELVRVDQRDEKVRIAKVGPDLVIAVTSPGEDVSVTVPISLARTVLGDLEDGQVTPRSLVAALREARMTTLADVRQGEQHVRVTVW